MVASIIVSIILLLLMGGLAFGAVILNLFDKVKDNENKKYHVYDDNSHIYFLSHFNKRRKVFITEVGEPYKQKRTIEVTIYDFIVD